MSAWAEYGFPDPRLLPSRLPMEGLYKALAERWLPTGARYNIKGFSSKNAGMDAVLQYDFTGTLRRLNTSAISGPASNDQRNLDYYIGLVCRYYSNHLRNFETSWTWGELAKAAAPEGLVEPVRLAPVLDARYAVQRYRMINLLRHLYLREVNVEAIAAGTHNGEYRSMASSVGYAFDNCYHYSFNGDLIENCVVGIYGPDHGWAEGTYCCNVTECANVSIPGKLAGTVMTFEVTAPGGDPANFDDMGFEGIALGTNTLRAQDGIFLRRQLPYYPPVPPTPVAGRFTYRGWIGKLNYIIDMAPNFFFYDNVEEG